MEYLDAEEDVIPLTAGDIVIGDLPIENYAQYKDIRAEFKLKDICEDFCKRFNERVNVKKLTVMEKAINIFHREESMWFKMGGDNEKEEDIDIRRNINLGN